jgi:hypothetical protein
MIRPTSVTVVSWIIIVEAANAIAALFSQFGDSVPAALGGDISKWWSIAVGVLLLVVGVLLLRGVAWARGVYVAMCVFSVLGLFKHYAFHLLFISLEYICLAYFLYRSEARAFFVGSKGGEPSVTNDAQQNTGNGA